MALGVILTKSIGRGLAAIVLMVAVTLSTPARAEWREATSEHFVIVSGGSEAQLVRMSQRLEAVHWLLTQATGVTTIDNGAKVRIYLVDDIGDVRRAKGLPSSSNTAGFYQPTDEGAIAVVPRNQDEFSTTILFHEYAHHFMLQYMRAAFPRWYVEGFAELISTASFEREGMISYGKVAEHRGYELQSEPWVPISRMMAAPSATDERAGSASYGQYWLAAHYFVFAPERRGQLRAYISAINNGGSPETAQSHFTCGMEQLDRDMRRYLRQNRFSYQQAPIPADVARSPTIRVMRPGEAAMIDDELQSWRPMTAEAHVPIAARVAALVARYPDDPAVGLLHARLLAYANRFADAEAAADRVLTIDPANVRALALKGRVMLESRAENGGEMDAAFVRQARGYIARANRLDPEDQIPLIAYFDSFRLAGEPATELAIQGLYKASRLVPQYPQLRMTVAFELLRIRRLAEARAMLAPLALSPHRSSGQAFALQLMQWIDAGATGDMPLAVADPVVEATEN